MEQTWQPIETAPEDRTVVELRGRYPKTDNVVSIIGFYDDTGTTWGWADLRHNDFYADHWRPLSAIKNMALAIAQNSIEQNHMLELCVWPEYKVIGFFDEYDNRFYDCEAMALAALTAIRPTMEERLK